MDIEPAEPRKTGHHKLDLMLAGTAVFLSIVSLGVAVLHGHTMERMAEANAQLVQANSWPFLEFRSSNHTGPGQNAISLTVSNNGVGPAKIYSAHVRYRGALIKSWDRFLGDCCTVAGEPQLQFGSSESSPVVLRAGEAITLLNVPQPGADSKAWAKLNDERHQVSYKFCFCSVFDDCWTTDGLTLRPQQVTTCPGMQQTFPAKVAESRSTSEESS
jgi:hypothetical protein